MASRWLWRRIPICHLMPTHNGFYICLKSEALWEEMCAVEKRLYDLIYQSEQRTTLIMFLVTKIPFWTHKRKAPNSNWGPWVASLERPTANLDSEFLLISSTDLLVNKVCLAIIGKLYGLAFNSLDKKPRTWRYCVQNLTTPNNGIVWPFSGLVRNLWIWEKVCDH